jgi:hypothetical protein
MSQPCGLWSRVNVKSETRGDCQRQNIKVLLVGVGRHSLYRLLRVYTVMRYRRIQILSTPGRKRILGMQSQDQIDQSRVPNQRQSHNIRCPENKALVFLEVRP